MFDNPHEFQQNTNIMYIPTQEERYAKKGIISLCLCVIVPSCLYLSLMAEQIQMIRGEEWSAIMKIFLAFAYPLAAVFSLTGLPFFWWSLGLSALIHSFIIYILKKSTALSPKVSICIALSIGMLNFLILKLWPFPADIFIR